MASPQMRPGIPVLRSFSEEKMREFYIDFLGMTLLWEHRHAPGMPLYCGLGRDGFNLHLTEHYGDASPGTTVFIPTKGVDALAESLRAKNARFARPGVQQQPWGREMTVSDPFGNRLTFCEQRDQAGAE